MITAWCRGEHTATQRSKAMTSSSTHCSSQSQEEVELDCTSQVADGLVRAPEIDQHLGDPAGGKAEVQDGEVGEEVVHGGVQVGV